MKVLHILKITWIIVLGGLLQNCQSFQPNDWELKIEGIGSSSSPRAIDLNQDGIKDIVVGGGAKEFTATQAGVIAINGDTGQLLWQTPARNQIVGTAIFQDITNDGIPDVFIGGRSAIFFALDGSNGKIIWEYLKDDQETDYFNDPTILNFYSPQFIPDIDGDGKEDILTAYGGFIKATEQDLDRPIGSFMVFSSTTGKLVSRAFVPDGKEIYCSPVVVDIDQDGQLEILFGTGGEYINGQLYLAKLEDILQEDLNNAISLADGEGKGFIAPPIIADITEDGRKDIIASSVNGRVIAFDGTTNEKLWEMRIPGNMDTYAMPAIGHFYGNDQIPDFFASFGKGAWPDTEFTVHALIDGNTGKLIMKDTLGTFQYASSVVADFNGDGGQDVLLSINSKVTSNLNNSNMRFLGTDLVVYPSVNFKPYILQKTQLGTNLGSTPLLTDLDDDHKLDVISMFMGDPINFYSFKNLIIQRKELNVAIVSTDWGGYMGVEGTSIFR